MIRLNEAWYVLGDPLRRSAYDRKREQEAIHQAEQEAAAKREETARREKAEAEERARKAEAARLAAIAKAEADRKATEERARCEAEAAAQWERPDINACRTGTNSENRNRDCPPGWSGIVARLIAAGGGLAIFTGTVGVLQIVQEGGKSDSWELFVFLLVGGGLAVAEAFGLNAGKSWAVSVPLWFCLGADARVGVLARVNHEQRTTTNPFHDRLSSGRPPLFCVGSACTEQTASPFS